MDSDGPEGHLDERTLNRFADGVLPERHRTHVRSHLHACETCRRHVQEIRVLSAALYSLPRPRPPAELAGRIFPESAGPATVPRLPDQARPKRRRKPRCLARLRALFS